MRGLATTTLFVLFACTLSFAQNVGINGSGSAPHNSAMLDISSSAKGFLMPRMTTAERNAIATPATGLQVFNTETNSVNFYDGSTWQETRVKNYVMVQKATDFPTAQGGIITLNPEVLYEIRGTINISPNAINLNGAMLKGNFPEKDIIASTVAGAILRSTDKHVGIEKISVAGLSTSTTAYDFSDATGTKVCLLHPGSNVIDSDLTVSGGVGKISGFRLVAFLNNYWRTKSGLKLGGNMGRFVFGFNYVMSISSGHALEFLPDLDADVVDIFNSQFNLTTGIALRQNAGTKISEGRLHSNMFASTATPISGFSQKNAEWWMSNNDDIADSKVLGMMYLSAPIENQAISTSTYQVVKGVYVGSPDNERFTRTTDQLDFTGKRNTLVEVTATMSVTPSANQTMLVEFEIRKNGVALPGSQQIMVLKGSDTYQAITLMGMTEVAPNDYIEIWGKSPAYSGWTVEKMMVLVK